MGDAAVTNPLDALLDTIDALLDESWEDAARWSPSTGWVDHDDGTDDEDWFMDHDEDYPPPLITRDGVRWLG